MLSRKLIAAGFGGVSLLAVSAGLSSANAVIVTVTGSAGAKGAPTQEGEAGENAVADAGFTTVNDDPSNRAFATGGFAGQGGDAAGALPPGKGGRGGNATARASAGKGATPGEFSEANAVARNGEGPGSPFNGDGGDGGDADAYAFLAPAGDGPGQNVRAESFAGDGGAGNGFAGGQGGIATARAELSGENRIGDSAHRASVTAVSGDGGFGDGRGGDGGEAVLMNPVSTSLDGSTVIFAEATGGEGGASRNGVGGDGGRGYVEQTLTLNNADSVDVRLNANGGRGGDTERGTLNGILSGSGGDAVAKATAINTNADASPNSGVLASTIAISGGVGQASTPGEIGKAGDAEAISVARTNSRQNIDANATARAGSTNARLVNGAYVQGEGGTAIASANTEAFSMRTAVSADADARASGGKLAEAFSRTRGQSFSGTVGAATNNQGVSAVASVDGQYFSEGVNVSQFNDNFVDVKATARAGSDMVGLTDEDLYSSVTSIVDTATFGEAGSVGRQLATANNTEALGGLTFFASADNDSNLAMNYETRYVIGYEDDALSVNNGDIFKLAFGDVIVSGDGFDLLEIDITYDTTTLLDVAFASTTEFFDFFTDGIFQTALPGEGTFSGTTFTIDINYVGTSPQAAPLIAARSLSSATAASIAGTAFGFNLLFGGGQGFFVAGGHGGGVTPEIPLPAAAWIFLAGLGGLSFNASRRRKPSASK
ncbi:MAG: VPLPA-CTERM sorting domain-containing protein [Pseudomonadota bacterium]